MINGKKLAIDARMVEMSGIGTYIQHLLGRGIYDYALGDEETIRKYDKTVSVIPFNAAIYSPKEQLCFPNIACRKAGVKLVHFPHYSVPFSYIGPFVVTVHDLTHIVYPEFLGKKIKYYYARILMGHALKRSKHIFTDSENSKKDITELFNIKPEKVSISYCAVDGDFRNKPETEVEYLYGKYNIPKDKKLLMYVGNLKPHKNLSRLIEAFAELENRDDYRLLLVGKAFKSTDLESEEERLGIRDSVIHTGLVEKEEIVDFYNLADLFVFPSLYEGFGLPPLEAMACGTPVIAANNSSIPEVTGDAAVLFDALKPTEIAKAIRDTLGDANMRNELIRKGYDRVKQFDWESTVEVVKGKLNNILKK